MVETNTQDQQQPFAIFDRGDRGQGVTDLQQKLADQGFDVGDVDGIYGRKTQAAALEYQIAAGLPQTNVFDGATYNSLMNAPDSTSNFLKDESALIAQEQEPAAVETTSSSNLLDFIGQGEGGYDSANRGTINGNIIGSQMTASRNGKNISSMTVGEIQRLQSISDPNNTERLFAVGKYQTIPITLANAVEGLGLSEDTVFSPEVQEQIGIFLIMEKRPRVGQFIRGEGTVTEDDAMMSLAREFASIPVPRAVRQGEFGSWPKTNLQAGDSFYSNPQAGRGNRASHSVEETRAVLRRARENQ